jgi:hypothetical protein
LRGSVGNLFPADLDLPLGVGSRIVGTALGESGLERCIQKAVARDQPHFAHRHAAGEFDALAPRVADILEVAGIHRAPPALMNWMSSARSVRYNAAL